MTSNHTVHLALGNPDRFRIMELLAGHAVTCELNVAELARRVGKSQSQTSQHLRVLRSAGLIVSRHEGTTVWNTVSPSLVWPVRVFRP